MWLTVADGDSHLWRRAAWVLSTLVTALNHWHGTPSSFSTLSFHFFPRCFTSEGFLLPAHHCKCWSPWRLLPDLICQSVNHYSQQEKGSGSTLKAISPPPWPPHQSCTTTHHCHLHLIYIQLCSRLLHISVFSLHLTMSRRGSFWASLNFSNSTIASEGNSPFRWSSRTGWDHVLCYANLVMEPDVNLNVPLICISEQPV